MVMRKAVREPVIRNSEVKDTREVGNLGPNPCPTFLPQRGTGKSASDNIGKTTLARDQFSPSARSAAKTLSQTRLG